MSESERFPTALNSTGDTYELQVTAAGNPFNVTAVALNVTVVDGEAASVGGYVTVFPCGERPDVSNLNFVNGQTVPNAVVAPVSADGRVCFYVYGRAHLLVDVAGYFTSGFTALSRPERMLNTRTSRLKVGLPAPTSSTGQLQKLPSGPISLGFDFSGAAAVLRTAFPVGSQSAEGGSFGASSFSNLFKIDESGQVASITKGFGVRVHDVEVSPNGNVYTVGGNEQCGLTETDPSTNISVCIEKSDYLTMGVGTPAVQFDSQGGVYYVVYNPPSPAWSPTNFCGTSVIRRYSDGLITDVLNLEKQRIFQWKVTSSGSVVFSGQRFSSDCGSELDHATKLVTRDGELSVISLSQTKFFSDFGTRSIYFGLCGEEGCGHRRFDPESLTVDRIWHLFGHKNGRYSSSTPPRNNDSDRICRTYSEALIGSFCGNMGTSASSFSATTSGKYFANLEMYWHDGRASPVFQYYPTVQPVLGTLVRSRTIATIGNDLFLAGHDAAGNFSTVRIDTNTGQETTVIPASAGYDVVQLEGDAAQGRLYFRAQATGGSGQLGRPDAAVFGYVTLSTGAITIKGVPGATVADVDPMVTN